MAKSYKQVAADTLVKTGIGNLHSVSIAPQTASATAGLVTIYDGTTESGTAIYSEWVFASGAGHTILLDCLFTVGLYVGYDATAANVKVTVTYE